MITVQVGLDRPAKKCNTYMEKWQCFRYKEDEEYEEYEEFEDGLRCIYLIIARENRDKLSRNDLCYCGSGKKYKNK